MAALPISTEYISVAADLLDAAMRACDHWNDSPAARQQMRRECQETPLHHRAQLIKHFEEQYP